MATFVSSLALSIIVLATMYAFMETSTRGGFSWAASWFQFFGLAIVCSWAAWRLYDVIGGALVTPQQLLAHCGIAAYAIGNALERMHAHTEHQHMHGAVKS